MPKQKANPVVNCPSRTSRRLRGFEPEIEEANLPIEPVEEQIDERPPSVSEIVEQYERLTPVSVVGPTTSDSLTTPGSSRQPEGPYWKEITDSATVVDDSGNFTQVGLDS